MDLIFSNSFNALKHGGLLGVVEHRAKTGTRYEKNI
jgi:predicted methyltransferase